MMLSRAAAKHLLIDSDKFGRKGLVHVGDFEGLDSIVTDTKPKGELQNAICSAKVEILVAERP